MKQSKMAPRDSCAVMASNLWDGEFTKLYERFIAFMMRLQQARQEYTRLNEELKRRKLELRKMKNLDKKM